MVLTSPDPVAHYAQTLRHRLGAGLVHLERLPPRPATHAELAHPLRPAVAERLAELGLVDL